MSNFSNFSNRYRYSLKKGSKKFVCPNCYKKTFVRYIDTETGDYLPEQYGRCDRESKCSHHLNPYLDGYAKMIWEQEQKVTGVTKVTVPKQKYFSTQSKPQPTPEPVFFDFDTFKQTLQPESYEKNTFVKNLQYRVQFPFEVDEIIKVIQLYRLGTVVNGYRAGANTFPFIDIKGNVRAVQVKQFDETNHTTATDFLHSIIEKHHTRNKKPLPEWLKAYIQQEKRVSCLFGEHLLSKYAQSPVALVEAPKTAVYGWLYLHEYPATKNWIWLAVYNKSSFSFDKLKELQGRDVFTFPDLSKDGSTFKEWETKAKEYENCLPGTRFIFSDLLERLATPEQRESGADIADVLIKQDWRKFRNPNIPEQPQPEPVKSEAKKTKIFSDVEPLPKVQIFKSKQMEPSIKEQPENWDKDITALESYFKSIELPGEPVKLNQCSTITNVPLFIDSHLATVKHYNGNRTFLPYFNRLNDLKQYFVNNKN